LLQTGTRFTIIPYRAAGSQREDLISGRIELIVAIPAALRSFLRESPSQTDAEKWGPLIKELRIKAE
jgi:hypothetical protein